MTTAATNLSLEQLKLLNMALKETTVVFELKNVFTNEKRLVAKANLAMVLRVMRQMPHTPLTELFAVDNYKPGEEQLLIRPNLAEFSTDYRIQHNTEQNARLLQKKYSKSLKN